MGLSTGLSLTTRSLHHMGDRSLLIATDYHRLPLIITHRSLLHHMGDRSLLIATDYH